MLPQQNYGGYQPTEEEIQQSQINPLVSALGITGVGAGGGFLIDAERRRRSEGGPKGFKAAAKESVDDLKTALSILGGNSAFDKQISIATADPGAFDEYRGIRHYAEEPRKANELGGELIDIREKDGYVRNPISQGAIAARDAFTVSAEDLLASERAFRESQGLSAEGPRTATAFSRIPMFDGMRDRLSGSTNPLINNRFYNIGYSPERMKARADHNVDLLDKNRAQQIGSLAGRAGADFINNGARSLWWLINAPQAVSDLVSEGLAGGMNRYGLYGVDLKTFDDAKKAGWVDEDGKVLDSMVSDKTSNRDSQDPYLRDQYQQLQESVQPEEGKQFIRGKQRRIFGKRRANNNLSTLLALPAAVGINAGLGLVNPFGGSDGYKAYLPSEEDPTKTKNVIGEVASKYILGRRGDILPWEEFKKVRPDVSKADYMAYKGYKYNKGVDLNPLDGDWNLGGIIKGTDDGIEGGEVMFLGKHIPTDTVLLPTLAAAGGSAIGAALGKHGALNPYGVEEGVDRRTSQIMEMYRNKDEKGFDINKFNRLNNQNNFASRRADLVDDALGLVPGLGGRGPMGTATRMKRIYGRNPVITGLVGGALGLGVASGLGHLNERQRREQKIIENQKRKQERGY